MPDTNVGDIGGELSGNLAGRDVNTQKAKGDKVGQTVYGNVIFNEATQHYIPLQRPVRAKPFVDRKEELDTLLEQLRPGETVTLCAAGGMGKTALASEAIWRLTLNNEPPEQFPDGIIYHSFYDYPQSEIALEHIILSLGGELDHPLDLTAQRLLSGKQVLLLLDGAEDADDLRRLQRLTNACGVIVTTRDRGQAPTPHQRQDMTPLPSDEALTLLQTLTQQPDSPPLRQICECLGGWPLAVRLVGNYLDQYKEPLTDYLAWLQTTPLTALDHGVHRDESVLVLLQRTIDRLSEATKTLLSLTSLLALAPFKRAWLTSALDKSYHQLRTPFNELVGYGLLVVVEETQYQLSHALIHTYLRAQLPPSTTLMEQLEQVLLHEAGELNKAGYPLALTWSGHLRTVTDLAIKEGHELSADLANTLGYYLKSIASYEGARPYYEQALTIRREVLGDRHPSTASSLNNLGLLLNEMGDYEGAWSYVEQALAICREVLGERHPSTAISLNSLGLLLNEMGDTEGARRYYEQALAIKKEVLGERHPDTANSLNNLGMLLNDMGDYEGARPYLEQALAIKKEVLGERHPDTAISLNNLGSLLNDMGDYEGARPYYEQALAICQEVLGDRHPHTAQSLNNLAWLCYDQEDFSEAARLMRQALAICEAVLGSTHSHTVGSRQALETIEAKLVE